MLAPFITDETVSKTEGGVRSDENYAGSVYQWPWRGSSGMKESGLEN